MEQVEKLTLLSLFINLAYAVYNAAIGFYTHSWWFVTLCLYFTVLSITRFSLLRIKSKSSGDLSLEIFAEKFTGVMFIILSVSLIGTVVLSVIDNHGTEYHEIVMITIALYVFVKMTLALINVIKARKNDSPVIKALRGISFADAFVSVFFTPAFYACFIRRNGRKRYKAFQCSDRFRCLYHNIFTWTKFN